MKKPRKPERGFSWKEQEANLRSLVEAGKKLTEEREPNV